MMPLVLAVLLVGLEADFGNALWSKNKTRSSNVGKAFITTVKKEVQAVEQVVASTFLSGVFSKCEAAKKELGIENMTSFSLNVDDLEKLHVTWYTPTSRENHRLSTAGESIPASPNFNPEERVCVLAHGFSTTFNATWFKTVEALLSKGECNVLAVDSRDYIYRFYFRATMYVQIIGRSLGRTLAALVNHGVDPSSIHQIGHSLGAHICGFAGKELTRLTGLRVGRISGLDPAGPCFHNASSDFRLNASDANFVDVIHTSAPSLGFMQPCGHADYYPNGGTQQPGCITQRCNHNMVLTVYEETILYPQTFLAVKCRNWGQFRNNKCDKDRALMGFGATSDLRGLFFLETNSESPYGRGENGTIYSKSEGMLKSIQTLGPYDTISL